MKVFKRKRVGQTDLFRKFSSVTGNESQGRHILFSSFIMAVDPKTDTIQSIQIAYICLEYESKCMIFFDFSQYIR